MKTSVIEVHDMLSVLSVLGVEKRIGEVPGVESVTVNFAVGSATLRYDETRLNIADIKSAVRQRGYASADEPPHEGEHKPANKAVGKSPPQAAPAAASPPAVDAPKDAATEPAKSAAASTAPAADESAAKPDA